MYGRDAKKPNLLLDQLKGNKEAIPDYNKDDYSEIDYIQALEFIKQSAGKFNLETVLTYSLENGTKIQRTIIQYLAPKARGHFALAKYQDLLDSCNPDAAVEGGPPIAWSLAATSTGAYHGNREFFFQSGLIKRCDLGAIWHGKSVLYILARTSFPHDTNCRDYLRKYPKLLAKHDLNLRADTGFCGERPTIGWYFTSTEEDCKFITSHPELIEKIDLNADPGGDSLYGGCTPAWNLANTKSGRAFLNRFPSYLAKCNLETTRKDRWGEDKNPAMWELLLKSDYPQIVIAVLQYRGIKIRASSYLTEGIVEIYENAFRYAAQDNNWRKLEELLKKKPWLLTTIAYESRDTLLHVILRTLSGLPLDQSTVLLGLHDSLFATLEKLREVENNDGLIPADLVANKQLKDLFHSPKSDFDAFVDDLLVLNHYEVIVKALTGIYRFDTEFHQVLKRLFTCSEASPTLFRQSTKAKIALLANLLIAVTENEAYTKRLLPGVDLKITHYLDPDEVKLVENVKVNLVTFMQNYRDIETETKVVKSSRPSSSSATETKKEIDPFILIVNNHFSELASHAEAHPDIIDARNGHENTLLHVILKKLDQFNDMEIALFLTKYSQLFEALNKLKSLTNAQGMLPVDLIQNKLLKMLFAFERSDFDITFDWIFNEKHCGLMKAVLKGQCRFPQDCQLQYESWSGSPASSSKTIEMLDPTQFVEKLSQAFEMLRCHYDGNPTIFTLTTASKINLLAREIRAFNTRKFKATPTILLNHADITLLQDFTNNLVNILHHYFVGMTRSDVRLQELPPYARSLAQPGVGVFAATPHVSANGSTGMMPALR